MSSFSGISTALSSLIAQRQALEVSGQNIANANTPGYTRQRADLTSVSSQQVPSMFSTTLTAGNGTRVSSITRMGDVFLDARVRAETGAASFAGARAASYAQLETSVAEPGDKGVANALQEFWAGWSDVGNDPASPASRGALLEDAKALAQRVQAGHAAATTQWSQTRTELDADLVDVNSMAEMVADLNSNIRGLVFSGGSPNELVDQRNVLVTKLSALVGANGVERPDGTLDVMVGGNALVRGDTAHAIAVNPNSYAMGQPVTLSWAGTNIALDTGSGEIAGLVTALAPADVTGNGGILAAAAAAYDNLATQLISQVNAQHGQAVTGAGVAGGTFFTSSGPSAAANLAVAITDGTQIAVGAPGAGPLDGSMADDMTQLSKQPGGPDSLWSSFVVDLGVTSRSASKSATITESTRSTAEQLQTSNASVDIDEESVNMLTYQRAYEGAARVLTTIDQMLDTLINRTGLVGR